jgi:hypothetical protein
MASARPPLDSPDGHPANAPPVTSVPPQESLEADNQPQPVSQEELNAWRRGFTPQAEIWNGRLAMVGLSVGLSVLIVARLAHHN